LWLILNESSSKNLSQTPPLVSLHPLKRLLRLALWLTVCFFLIFGSLALALRTQWAQTTVVQFLAGKVSEKLGFKCTIGGFYLDWVDFARITDVEIKDLQGQTMIKVSVLKVNLKLAALLERNINLDLVELKRGIVQVRVDRKTQKININEFIDRIMELVDDGDTTRSPNPKIFSIDKAKLENMSFAYLDETEEKLVNQFDYYHFKLVGINGLVNNFWQRRDTISLVADKLRAVDAATGLKIYQLSTDYRFTKKNMLFQKLEAKVGDSYIRDSLAFNYESVDDFSNFNQKVEIIGNLDSSVITSQDVSFFAPTLKDWFETYNISGQFNGTVDNFRIRKFKLFTGKNTFLTGNLSMRGLPEVDETFMDLRLKPSFINPQDLEFYAGKSAAEYLSMLGVFDVSGSFTGFFKNFVTKSVFRTDLGILNADMQMEIKDDLQASTYNGRLKTSSFDFGRLIKQKKYLQKIDLDGSFEGTGFEPNRINLFLDAQINRLGVLGYDYANIKTKGHFQKLKYQGSLVIKDPHLIFNGSGNINLAKGKEVVDFDAILGRANFKQLKLTPDQLDVSTEVSMHFTGFDFDNFIGTSEIQNLRVLYKDERLDLNEVSIESHIIDNKKTFTFNSELADAKIEGSFKYKKLVEDATDLVDEYWRLIKNRKLNNQNKLVSERLSKSVDYGIDANINLKNIDRLLDLLDLPINVSANTKINAQLDFGNTEMALINSHIDSFRVQEKRFYQTDIDISSVKTLERPDVIAEIYAYSKKQNWNQDIETEKLMFNGLWNEGKINFKILGNQTATTNKADIKGEVLFEPQTTRIKLQNSALSLVERLWKINNGNQIEISDSGTIKFDNVTIANEDQKLSVEGYLTGSQTDTLLVKASNFQIATLKPIMKEDIDGMVNARIAITNLSESPLFEGFLNADSLVYNKYLIGNFVGNADWNQAQKNLEINGDLTRENQKIINLTGFYTPSESEPINMRARVNRLNINVLQIILGNTVSNLKGFASGDLIVQGSFSKPNIQGSLMVKEGQVKINYLSTTYYFNHQINFLRNEINANGANLIDENGQIGVLNKAVLRHNYFSDFKVDLDGNLNQFMVFNLVQKTGSLYFGTAICTGNLKISGGFDDIFIKANAVTNKGTKIFIPLDGATNEDLGESFITFTDRGKRKDTPKDSVGKVRLSGIKMVFDLDVTEDAYGEIIFDKKAGDIIRANGSGKIRMTIDTRGEFSVIGQYAIKKGDYHFTTYNLVNKDFDIKPGSTITWNGPVLEGVMDILAEYNLNASLAPLAASDPQIQEKPEAKRRYPVLVSMRLTEQLLKPNIVLGLEIKDYPKNSDLNYYVQAFQTRIATDEQELNRQVFSLMIFRMFAPMGDFVQASNISYSSFSDLVSNQLSSWLSEFDENLEVSVDLNGLSQSAISNFQLRFSYTLLEGKLRLTRDGSFTNAQNQTSALSIAGDWTLEYLLTNNGNWRVKMFHRINQNLVLSGLNNNNSTQGGSVLFTQSFNRISDLFPKKKKKAAAPKPKRDADSSQIKSAALNSKHEDLLK
jgi:hypothetical protein